MNRKAKNIIFFTFVAIFALVFVVTLVLGGIYNIAGSGTTIVRDIGQIFGKGAAATRMYTFMKVSPYVCIASGLILSFMFYKKYNTRIN